MTAKLKIGPYPPITTASAIREAHREVNINAALHKVAVSSRGNQAVVVMRKKTSLYEWRIYEIPDPNHLLIWAVVEDIKALKQQGYSVQVYTFQPDQDGILISSLIGEFYKKRSTLTIRDFEIFPNLQKEEFFTN